MTVNNKTCDSDALAPYGTGGICGTIDNIETGFSMTETTERRVAL